MAVQGSGFGPAPRRRRIATPARESRVVEEAAATPAGLSRLDIGVIIVLVAMGFAGVVGLIAVFDAGSDVTAFGIGFGAALLIFQAGATIACALACLARRRFEALSIGALVAAGLSVDLFLLAIWLDIDDETYGKVRRHRLRLGVLRSAHPRAGARRPAPRQSRPLALSRRDRRVPARRHPRVRADPLGRRRRERRRRSDRHHVHRGREPAPTSRRSARRARLAVVRGSRGQPRRSKPAALDVEADVEDVPSSTT